MVEGNAEYILLERMYEKINKSLPKNDRISIISCGGITFKNYLNVAKMLDKKVAVITDNDGDYIENITNNYNKYNDLTNIEIFSDTNNENKTFEICLYKINRDFFEDKFYYKQMNNGLQSYMLANKAEFAFRLLNALEEDNIFEKFIIPSYIEEAVKWIKK